MIFIVFYIIDIILHFFTGFYDKGSIIRDNELIALANIKSRFSFDFLSLLVNFINLFDHPIYSITRFFAFLRIISINLTF